MKTARIVLVLLCAVLFSLVVSSCGDSGSNGNGNIGTNEAAVTVRGRADDGTPTSAIANAVCRFVSRTGSELATATADGNGEFSLAIPPDTQGFLECTPPGLPNLILMTFVSTVGTAVGESIPAQGSEEVSPRTTVIAAILQQTSPSDLQTRKTELLADLAAQAPDITALITAMTELFNTMLQQQISAVDFSINEGSEGGEGGESGPGGGESSADAGGGAAGEAGDGAEASPLANAQCEFVRESTGDSALEDLLLDGSLDHPALQGIAAAVQQNTSISEAFARLFPDGIQPLANGQPLRTITNANGAYFLHVPPGTPGFIRCGTGPHLTVSTFVRARQIGERLTGQDVSPSSQVFSAFIVPQLTSQDVQAVENNFLRDIGDLKLPSAGIVRMETVATPQGRIVADTNGDGLVCSLLINNAQEGSIEYLAAGATSYTAIALFKALVIEARNPASASYETILADVLRRKDQTGNPRVEILAADLQAGGVPASRAAGLAADLNKCIQDGVVRVLGLRAGLPRMVLAGRFRVTVRDPNGVPVSRARVGGRGSFSDASDCRDAQGQILTPIERTNNLIVCSADDNGRITFVLVGEEQLTATPVVWSVRSPDGTKLLGEVNAPFVPAVTLDAPVTVPAP